MKELKRIIRLYRRINAQEAVETRHEEVMEGLSSIEAPLGLQNSEIPSTPDFATELRAFYSAKNIDTKGVKIEGSYGWRGGIGIDWDELFYYFKVSYKQLNYEKIIYVDLTKVVELYNPYVADIHISSRYAIAYEEGRTPETMTYGESKNSKYLELKKRGINIGMLRDQLFTLSPVMYFSDEMCQKVIKLSKEEIYKKLERKAKKVSVMNYGIYIVFNDTKDISYEEFLEMNNTFKPILGLI